MRNLRNFGITFAVSLVVLGIIALFAGKYVANAVTDIFNTRDKELAEIISPGNQDVDSSGENSDELFDRDLDGESFTWLMVVTDKRPDVYDYYPTKGEVENNDKPGVLGGDYKAVNATSIAVVHASVETREYVVLTIPTITKIETGTGTMSLGQVYGVYGIEYLREKVASIIGIDVDYYTAVNSTDLTKLTSTIGAVECELPVNIGYDGKEYVTYVKEKEEKKEESLGGKLNGDAPKDKETKDEEENKEPEIKLELDAAESVKLSKKLMPALLYRDYSDGIDQEMIILRSFVCGVMKNLSAMSDTSLTSCLTGLKSVIKETNITKDDIPKCGETVRAYSWLPVNCVVYGGRFVEGAANRAPNYIPDISEMINYFYKYR